ncbi:MAG: hypothetical protein R3F11_27130 [Verrucomicrobiales bacterium]
MPDVDGTSGFVRVRIELDDPASVSRTLPIGWCRTVIVGDLQSFGANLVGETAFSGMVEGVVGGSAFHVPTSAGERDLTAVLDPAKLYYAEITGGPAEGHRFDVGYAATTADTLALDLGSPHNTSSTLLKRASAVRRS